MKKTFIIFMGILWGSLLPLTISAAATPSSGTTQTDVTADLAELVQAEKGIQQNLAEIIKTRTQLEKAVLSQINRSSLQDILGKDRGTISNYRAEILDDVEFLSSARASGYLTQAQKDLVAEARVDLEDGSSAF